MRRTHRALALLALSLSLVTATATVAAATPAPAAAIEDQHDRLLRNLQAGHAERSEAAVQLHRSMERNLNRTAAVSLPAPIEDQHDRLLRNLQATQAERTQATVQLARAMERNLEPAPPVGAIAAQPAPRSDPAVPGRDVAVLTTLLVGLIGGLVGGAAAIAGWAAASRRRPHRAASAT